MRNVLAGCVLVVLFGAGWALKAEVRPKLPEPMKSIEANISVSYVVVSGTVTVRVRGVRSSPPDVTFRFQPSFPGGSGYLVLKEPGVYRLHVDKVPSDKSYVLTIRSAFNDAEMRNGRVYNQGKTYSGALRIDIPHGRDFSFGEQLLDLR